ncbi:hypothetical protein ZIOFF_016790 [Zingiber officinale]|uniref:Uncharacterized protein n=1 Tax=Zingiber officinale TaxID=94328 RepID=A0A8J5HWL6_ZINOF|nr:hypothetical protein ZIOFF_016790 [Zingiber officinale]
MSPSTSEFLDQPDWRVFRLKRGGCSSKKFNLFLFIIPRFRFDCDSFRIPSIWFSWLVFCSKIGSLWLFSAGVTAMELVADDAMAEGEDVEAEPSLEPLVSEPRHFPHFPGAVRQKAYLFDGLGSYFNKEWDLKEGHGREFCWYQLELPKGNQKLAVSAQYLIDVLCPPLKLQDILTLISNGPFCGYVDGALVFRVNSPGPAASSFTMRLAVRVTENSVITVSLGRVPRLGFSPTGQSLLSEIPSVEGPGLARKEDGRSGIVIREHVLEFLLTMNHSEEADNPVPHRVSNLVVHIIDTHVDHVQDIVTKLEMELDSVELELDKGGSALKKQMLDDRRFPKMHLNIQRLLQVVSHGEQVFPRVKEKCSTKSWFANEDIVALEELIGRLRSIRNERWWCAMDSPEISRAGRWISECLDPLWLDCASDSNRRFFSFALREDNFLAKAACHEEELVDK